MKGLYILKIVIGLLITMIVNSAVYAQQFKVFAVSDLKRVFEDGYHLPPISDTIKIFGIRGEILSGQCAVSAKKDLADLTVELSPLRDKVTGNSLPSTAVEWNFVGSIPLDFNTPNYPLASVARKAPARFPDYLMAERHTHMKNGTYLSVWLTVHIPPTAGAGTYLGNVVVKSAREEQSLPVLLTVYPFTLPSERHLNIVEWYNTRNFESFHGIKGKYSDEWFAMLRKYADNMVAHRQNSFRVTMDYVDTRQLKDGSFIFDFSLFDRIAEVFWDTGKMDYLETGFLAQRGEKGWYDTNFRWKDITVIKSETGQQLTLPGEEVIPSLVSAFEAHLRRKGWLNKTWFHIQDEPVVWNASSWIEFSKFIHRYAPDLTRMDAIETSFLLDDIEIAVPKLNYFASWYDTYKKAQEKGVGLWFYTVGIHQGSLNLNKTIDMPVIQSRTMHWLNYKYDATGYLHWGWNQWTEDPYNEVGKHLGDGWHVYPAKDGVLNSLRWEQMRNGIQDYEYFCMLEHKISALKDSLGSRFHWIDPKQRGKEISGRVIQDFSVFSNDPNVLYKAKKEIINEMLNLRTSPKIYIQTNPVEGASMYKEVPVELFGWTEPGTNITINGEVVPVSEHGLFVTKVNTARVDDFIGVRATHAKGSKEMIRKLAAKP